jgi:hypothetical protein
MARELGIEVAEEETQGEELLRRVKEKMVEDLVGQATTRPSALEAAVSGLLSRTDSAELVRQVGAAMQMLRARRSGQDEPSSGATEERGPGSLPE